MLEMDFVESRISLARLANTRPRARNIYTTLPTRHTPNIIATDLYILNN